MHVLFPSDNETYHFKRYTYLWIVVMFGIDASGKFFLAVQCLNQVHCHSPHDANVLCRSVANKYFILNRKHYFLSYTRVCACTNAWHSFSHTCVHAQTHGTVSLIHVCMYTHT